MKKQVLIFLLTVLPFFVQGQRVPGFLGKTNMVGVDFNVPVVGRASFSFHYEKAIEQRISMRYTYNSRVFTRRIIVDDKDYHDDHIDIDVSDYYATVARLAVYDEVFNIRTHELGFKFFFTNDLATATSYFLAGATHSTVGFAPKAKKGTVNSYYYDYDSGEYFHTPVNLNEFEGIVDANSKMIGIQLGMGHTQFINQYMYFNLEASGAIPIPYKNVDANVGGYDLYSLRRYLHNGIMEVNAFQVRCSLGFVF